MVKVRENEQRKLTSLPSLGIAFAAASLIVLSWWLVREEPQIAPRQRTILDVLVTWECPSGARFLDAGSLSPFPCPDGSGTGSILLTYESPDCQQFELHGRYVENENGQIILSAVRVPGEEIWTPVENRIRCPQTGTPAKPVSFSEGTAKLKP